MCRQMKTFARFGTKWMSQRQRSTFFAKATTRELWRRWVRLLFLSPNKFLPSGRAGLCLLVTFACCQHCKCGSFDPWGPQGAIFFKIPIDFLSFSQFCNALALPHLTGSSSLPITISDFTLSLISSILSIWQFLAGSPAPPWPLAAPLLPVPPPPHLLPPPLHWRLLLRRLRRSLLSRFSSLHHLSHTHGCIVQVRSIAEYKFFERIQIYF